MRLAIGWGDGKTMGDLVFFHLSNACGVLMLPFSCRVSHCYCPAQERADRIPCALMAPRSGRWLYVMSRFHAEPLWGDVEVEYWVPSPDPGSLPCPQGTDAFGGKQAGSACTPFWAPRQAGRVRVGGREGWSGPFCTSVRSTWPVSSPSPGYVPKSPPRPQQIPTPFSKPQGGIGS